MGAGNTFVAVNDTRTTSDDYDHTRWGGLVTIFHRTLDGFARLEHLPEFDIPNRYLLVSTWWNDRRVYFHNVYAPVERDDALRSAFFDALPRDFEPTSIHVIGGDFNLAMDRVLDARNPSRHHSPGREACVAWLSRLDVVDTWRLHHPDLRQYSSPRRSARLDYLLVDRSLMQAQYRSSKYFTSAYAGDHACHEVVLAPVALHQTKSSWKLPKELLQEPTIVAAILAEARTLMTTLTETADPPTNSSHLWHSFCTRTKSALQKAQSLLHRGQSQFKTMAKLEWFQAQQHAALHPDQPHVLAAAEALFDQRMGEAKQFDRDRQFDWHASKSETSTSHFFRPPPQLLYKVPIVQVLLNDGTLVDAPDAIQEAFNGHWKDIMCPATPPPPDIAAQDRLLALIMNRLDADDRTALDAPIAAEEMASAICAMAPGKSPGLDGFPAAFYQLDPLLFGTILGVVFNHRLSQGTLMKHQRHSAVVLLFKGGDRNRPGNYRPIALLPVEVKVLAKVLAHRLASVLAKLIHPLQAGFVRGRRLHDHAVLVQNLVQHCTSADEEGYATFLDMYKAYDMVQWSWMYRVLDAVNIGDKFIQWVQLLYRAPTVQLLINGALAPVIRPTRGVKQGCPLSALLFVLSIEPLGQLLRHDDNVRSGISLPDGRCISALFFADDTTLISSTRECAVEQLALVEVYCQASGAKLHPAKCKTLVLNQLQGETAYPGLTIVPRGVPIKYLGVYFGHQLDPAIILDMLSTKFYQAFSQWGSRARTVRGRILLVNTVILSLLWHTTAVTAIPSPLVAKWQGMVNRFVLGRKTNPDDKYLTLVDSSVQFDRDTGLRIPHIASTIRKQRVKRLSLMLAEAETAFWAYLSMRQFGAVSSLMRRPNDFLYYTPSARSSWVQTGGLTPLMLDMWHQWAEIPLSTTLNNDLALQDLLVMPVWLQRHPALLLSTSRGHGLSLAHALRHNRPFYSHIAGLGFCSLHDFFLPNGDWPNPSQLDQLLWPDRGAHIVDWPTHVRFLHSVLTTLLRQVHAHCHVLCNLVRPPRAPAKPPFARIERNVMVSVTSWSSNTLRAVAWHPPTTLKRHPMFHGVHRRTHAQITRHVGAIRKLMALPAPIYGDVWFRLLFRMLPVQSRFYFLQHLDPAVLECTYNTCHAVESERHAFRDCPFIRPIWDFHQSAWQVLGVQFSWENMLDLDLTTFHVHDQHKQHREAIFQLWIILVAGVFHTIWTHRNNTRFVAYSNPPQLNWHEATVSLWATNVRRILRLQPPGSDEFCSLRHVMDMLSAQPMYRGLWQRHPLLLQLRPVW